MEVQNIYIYIMGDFYDGVRVENIIVRKNKNTF